SATEIDFLFRRQRLDDAAAVAIADVEPVVDSPAQAVDAVLLIPFAKAAVEDRSLVRLVIAVLVLGIKDVRGGRDEDSFPPDFYASRKRNLVEKDRRLVVPAVAVDVGQHLYAAARLAQLVALFVPGDAVRIVAHLDDPQ